MVKCLPAIQETLVQSFVSERSPAEGSGNPLQYSCLEDPMDRGVSVAGYRPWGCKESDMTE